MARSGWYGGYEFYEKRSAIKADGIKSKSRSGNIAETWWGRNFISVLESFGIGARLSRGKSYARQGQVLTLDFAPGVISARVQGSRRTPYKVTVKLHALTEKDWENAESKMAESALFLAKLLGGEMPANIDEVFKACNISLLPQKPSDLATECSCPDWSNPCKHVAAVLYLVGERLDEDPFLIFAWRGRSKKELLESLSTQQGVIKFATRKRSESTSWQNAVISEVKVEKLTPKTYWKIADIPEIKRYLVEPDEYGFRAKAALDGAKDLLKVELGGPDLMSILEPAYDAFPKLSMLLENEED